ncbi:hypothetical protein HNP38_002219 [Chryseobacterium defluvii]|uniref:Uncharacterized protein n=1 Tax=Chryseobacterium defluvii TaxID=160396 RepID=A0A840KHD1_9FLAO|nr:hypothetical protein [Chryseobacterium defluvii]MBB4806923.1 hypothetical protein [Chryseobacterium defluvii]
MQNIQDLKEKIFFESKNIIDILEKINNVDELLSKQDLVDELANRISFLRLLEKNIEYFIQDNSFQNSDNQYIINTDAEVQEFSHEVTEEEAIFNNELNEIDDHSENIQEESSPNEITEEEAVFNNQLNEIDESEPSDYQESVLNFIDEERILANAEPDNDDGIHEGMFTHEVTEEEAIFNNQLNEIDQFENEVSDYQGNADAPFDEEEKIQDSFEQEISGEKEADQTQDATERIPSIFDTEIPEDDILIEEDEERFITSNTIIEQGEMASETSNVENIVNEIKNEAQAEEKQEEIIISGEADRRKIVEIDRPSPETEKERPASDESFENIDAYNQEKKIKLANIKGLKAVQTLFDDDPLERNIPQEKPVQTVESTGSILKTNIPTDYMEAEKTKPEFRLDLNDRIAFTKTLFGGSQSELNEVVTELNSFKTLEEAKEYLSELYYEKNWKKADEYAQRLWVLVENKFL